MKKNDLSVFKLESEGFKIVLEKHTGYQPVVSQPVASAPAAQAAPATAAQVAESATAKEPAPGKEIVSPMVGTFYAAGSPETPAFVTVGQAVTEDTVVCIIEAMKVMNEIKADIRGVITEIVAENGKPVQYGQALFKIK
jgi:acetyl-CoA carboxylase biotin carboxyl carrier protein